MVNGNDIRKLLKTIYEENVAEEKSQHDAELTKLITLLKTEKSLEIQTSQDRPYFNLDIELCIMLVNILFEALKENTNLNELSLFLGAEKIWVDFDFPHSHTYRLPDYLLFLEVIRRNEIRIPSLTFSCENFTAWIKVLKTNNTISSIKIYMPYEIEPEFDKNSIVEWFTLNNTLRSLTLEPHNDRLPKTITDGIAMGLKLNKTLTALNIDQISDEIDGKLFAEVITLNNTLTSLDIGNIRFEEGGEEIMLAALQSNQSLIHIGIGLFKKYSMKRLATVLENNHTLLSLCLYQNHAVRYYAEHGIMAECFGEEDIEEIINALRINNSLRHFSFEDDEYNFNEKNIDSILAMLKENKCLQSLKYHEYDLDNAKDKITEVTQLLGRNFQIRKATLLFKELASLFGQAARTVNQKTLLNKLGPDLLQIIAGMVSGAGFLPGFENTRDTLKNSFKLSYNRVKPFSSHIREDPEQNAWTVSKRYKPSTN